MPDFEITPTPPRPSPPVGQTVERCPVEPEKAYQVEVSVVTRAGEFPLNHVQVMLDDVSLGRTNKQGKVSLSQIRTKETSIITVKYLNSVEKLKSEFFKLTITDISSVSKSYCVGNAENFISKVQDVFGSGTSSMQGDLDFKNVYPYDNSLVSMTDTEMVDIKLLKVIVKMATLSLQVPYLSQIGDGETLVTQPATPSNPKSKTHRWKGHQICMPTSTTMLLDYWNIKSAKGGKITRKNFMQRCWNEDSKPSTAYPSPWQNWSHLRKVTKKIINESTLKDYSVTNGPPGEKGGTELDGGIPSSYANGIVGELAKGRPVVTSTYATNGHVMVVRGAIIDHEDNAQWLIINDPNGNLASPHSIYAKLDIAHSVGFRSKDNNQLMNLEDDVEGVREALKKLKKYSGPITGPIDENNINDPTIIAIKKLQGKNSDGVITPGKATEKKINSLLASRTSNKYSSKEQERNKKSGKGSDKGRHVYYSSTTEAVGVGKDHHFRLKLQGWTLVIEPSPTLSNDEISAKLIKGE